MSISTLLIKRCKLAPTVIVLYTRNFACINVRAKPFYVHENQCTQILNLWSPVIGQSKFPGNFFDFKFDQVPRHKTGLTSLLFLVCFYTPWKQQTSINCFCNDGISNDYLIILFHVHTTVMKLLFFIWKCFTVKQLIK